MPKKRSVRVKRQIVPAPGGKPGRDFMSEFSATVTNRKINKGKPTNIPTVFGGKIRSDREAVRRIHQSGGIDPENPRRGKLKSFKDIPTAVKAAAKRSNSLNKKRGVDSLKAKLKGKSQAKPKSKKSRK